MEILVNEQNDTNCEEDGINCEALKEEETQSIQEKVKSNHPEVRMDAYDEILSSISDNQKSLSVLSFDFPKFLEDSFPVALESALNVLIEIYDSHHELSNDINIEQVIKLTIEKAYATSRTSCRNKCKKLLCIILQRASFVEKFLEVVKTILSYSVSNNEKVILFCEQILLHILSEFGAREINYGLFIKEVVCLIEESNDGIRSEALNIVKAIYKWERDGVKVYLSTLNENVIKDLNKEFAAIDENEPSRPIPKRIITGKVQDAPVSNDNQQEKHCIKMDNNPKEIEGTMENTPVKEETISMKTREIPRKSNEEIPISPLSPRSSQLHGTEEPAYQQKTDLEEFERKLEEAMKKEEAKHSMNADAPNKKAASKRTANEKQNENKSQEEEINEKISSMIGDETANLLQSTKWEEKKQGFIQLNEWLKASGSSLRTNVDNFITFTQIKLKDYKETNFNVLREACNVYTTCLAKYSGKGFDKKHALQIIKGMFEKMGDSKLKEALSNLLNSLMEHIGPKFIIITILGHLNNEKNKPPVNVLKEYATFFEKVIEDFGIALIPVKEMIELCKIMSGHTNPQVRASATGLLCVLYKYVGNDIKAVIKDIKESTLKIILAEFAKVTVIEPSSTSNFQPKRKLKEIALQEEGGLSNKQNQADLIPRVDVSKKITPKILKDIIEGKWKDKKEACEMIENILKDANMKILPTGLNELFATIKGKLGDGNKNLVRLMVSLLSKLIEALGGGFKSQCKTLSGPLIGNLADKMQMLKDDVQMCLDRWVDHVGLDTIVIYVPNYLKQDNFDMRTELLKFLNKYKYTYNSHKTVMEITFKDLISPLLGCLQDKAASIRTSAEELIQYSLRFVPLNLYLNGLNDLKPAIANTLRQVLDKYKEDTTGTGIAELNMTISNKSITLKSDKSNPEINSGSATKGAKTQGKKEVEKDMQGKKEIPQQKEQYFNTIDSGILITIGNSPRNKKLDDSDHINSSFLKQNAKGFNNSGTNISPPFLPPQTKKMSTTIFLPNITLKPSTKEKRLEIDKKYKFSLETLNEDFAVKLKEQLRCLFTSEFLEKLFNEELKSIIDVLTSIFTSMRDEENWVVTFSIIYVNLDVILKWVGWKLNNNQNPLLIKILLEFFEVLQDKLLENDLKLNDTEAYIVLSLLIDKLGSSYSKLKDNVRALIDKYLQIISANKAFQIFLYSSATKNSKIKAECLDICGNMISTGGVGIACVKDLKYIAKFLIANDTGIKASTINLLQYVYFQIKEKIWEILADTPDQIKEQLYSIFNQDACNCHSNVQEMEEEEGFDFERKTKANNSILTADQADMQYLFLTESNSHLNTLTNSAPQCTLDGASSLPSIQQNELLSMLQILGTSEISEKVNTIIFIHELICTKFEESKNVLIQNVDLIVSTLISELKKQFEQKKLSEIPIKLGKYLITVLNKISSNKELIKNVSYQVLFKLAEQVLSCLLIENLDKIWENPEGVTILKSLNSTMLKVLENCNNTDVICILLELAKNYRTRDDKESIAGLAIKCLFKINQILAQIIDDLQVNKILVQVHILLAEYDKLHPDLAIYTPEDQLVVDYIKNLVSELVKLKKEGILNDYMNGVESHSVNDKYLKHWIKNILSALNIGQEKQSNSTGIPNETTHEAISKSNLDNLIQDKNQLQQSKDNQSKPQEKVLAKNSTNPVETNYPSQKQKQNEMYTRIIHLKSKLESYHNSSYSPMNSMICEKKVITPNDDHSSDNFSQNKCNTLESVSDSGKSFIETIIEIKRKWKSQITTISQEISPLQGSKGKDNSQKVTSFNNNTSTDPNIYRLIKIKKKLGLMDN